MPLSRYFFLRALLGLLGNWNHSVIATTQDTHCRSNRHFADCPCRSKILEVSSKSCSPFECILLCKDLISKRAVASFRLSSSSIELFIVRLFRHPAKDLSFYRPSSPPSFHHGKSYVHQFILQHRLERFSTNPTHHSLVILRFTV